MPHHPLKTSVVCTFVASCGLLLIQPLTAQTPTAGTRSEAPRVSIDRAIPVHAPVDAQMRTMAQHARERMILYPGKFAPGDLAGAKRELNAIAMRLQTSGKSQKKAAPFTAPSLWMQGGRARPTGRQ